MCIRDRALADQGASVTLVSGPTALPAPIEVNRLDVETAQEMLATVTDNLPADIFISVAAVADWRPAICHDKKAPKPKDGAPVLEMAENPDILATDMCIRSKTRTLYRFRRSNT